MGKKGGTSWLTEVKRAFRSPTKDTEKIRNTRRKEDHDQEDDDEKKREKRWLFRKPTVANQKTSVIQQPEQKINASAGSGSSSVLVPENVSTACHCSGDGGNSDSPSGGGGC